MPAKAARRLHRNSAANWTPPRDKGILHRIIPNYLLLNVAMANWMYSNGDDFAALWALTKHATDYYRS